MSSAVELTNKQFLTSRKEDIEGKLHAVTMRLQALSDESQQVAIQYSNAEQTTDDGTALAPGAALSTGANMDALIGVTGSTVALGTMGTPAQTQITFTDGAGVTHNFTYEQATAFIAAESKALELKDNDLQSQLTDCKTEMDSVDKLLGDDTKKEYSYSGQG